MKPIYKEFNCPQCGKLRYIKVNGICFECRNKNTLTILAIQRKLQQKLKSINLSLNVENYS